MQLTDGPHQKNSKPALILHHIYRILLFRFGMLHILEVS
jgi:hypothetical protein